MTRDRAMDLTYKLITELSRIMKAGGKGADIHEAAAAWLATEGYRAFEEEIGTELVRLRTENEMLKSELLKLVQATMLDLEEDGKRLEALREEFDRGHIMLETVKRYLDKLSNPAPTEP